MVVYVCEYVFVCVCVHVLVCMSIFVSVYVFMYVCGGGLGGREHARVVIYSSY